MKVSIIIPCKYIDAYVMECVSKCLEIDYTDYEIMVMPDHNGDGISGGKVRVISTGSVSPLMKRFIASSFSTGDILAFIDSDAYPAKDWLKNALRHFSDPSVACVVGPSITPANDDFMSRASGAVLSSPIGGGLESIRYKQIYGTRYVNEAPACNMLIRKHVFAALKDSVPDVWPGEEIVLCGMIVKDFKMKILYDPNVVVFHHRRKLFIPHLQQIWRYGVVKGYLLKRYRRYIRPIFFIPSLLVLGIVTGLPGLILIPSIGYIYSFSLLLYLFLSIYNAILMGLKEKSGRLFLVVLIGTIATHVCYGIAFLRGMFLKKL